MKYMTSHKKVADAYLRGHRKVSTVDEAMVKWLLKRSQKIKGVVQMDFVVRAFDMMEGWSITDTTTYFLLNGQDDAQKALLKPLMLKLGADDFGRSGTTKESIDFWYDGTGTQQRAEKGRKIFTREVDAKHQAKAKAPTGKAKVMKLYSSPPGDIIARYGRYEFPVDRMWVGLPGWIITANGKSLILPHPMTYRGGLADPNRLDKLTKFWTWSYKNGLAESAKAALESLNPEAVELAGATVEKRKRLEIQRIMLPEVKVLLVSIVNKKFQEVWDWWALANTQAVQEYIKAQEATWDDAKAKGKVWPRWDERKGYKNDAAKFYWKDVRAATEPDKSDKERLHGNWRKLRGNWQDILRARAKAMAEQIREEFVWKNTGKLSLIIRNKGTQGNPLENLDNAKVTKILPGHDFGGEISISFKDGSRFTVRNKTISKISTLGNLFNQFPTTFHNVVMPNGKKMSAPSEERMLKVFAVA